MATEAFWYVPVLIAIWKFYKLGSKIKQGRILEFRNYSQRIPLESLSTGYLGVISGLLEKIPVLSDVTLWRLIDIMSYPRFGGPHLQNILSKLPFSLLEIPWRLRQQAPPNADILYHHTSTWCFLTVTRIVPRNRTRLRSSYSVFVSTFASSEVLAAVLLRIPFFWHMGHCVMGIISQEKYLHLQN